MTLRTTLVVAYVVALTILSRVSVFSYRQMKGEASRLLVQRSENMQAKSLQTKAIIVLGNLVAAFFLAGAALATYQEMGKRDETDPSGKLKSFWLRTMRMMLNWRCRLDETLDFIFCRAAHAERNFEAPRATVLGLKPPKTDGFEVLKELNSNPLTKTIPFVILAASPREPDLMNSCRLGANGYIEEPVDFERFLRTVKQPGLFWLVVKQPPPRAAFQGG